MKLADNKMFVYSIGRIAAIGSRPLSLFLINNYGGVLAAQDLAMTFLISTLSMLGTNPGTFRRFYQLYFDEQHERTFIFSQRSFLYSFVFQVIIGFGFILLMYFFKIRFILLAVSICLYYLSEKIVDEVLRFWLFEKKFSLWGKINFFRSVFQIIGIGIFVLLFGEEVKGNQVVLFLAACNLIFFLPKVHLQIFRIFFTLKLKYVRRIFWKTFSYLYSHRLLWSIGVLGAAIAYIERILALVIKEELLPLFMMISMCFAFISTFVDFFYCSRYRKDFLEGKVTPKIAFANKNLIYSIFGGIAAATIASLFILLFAKGGNEFPLKYVLAIALIQVSLALTAIPYQIIYWRNLLPKMFQIEIAFWTFLAFVGGFFLVLSYHLSFILSLDIILVCITGFIVVRCAAYYYLSIFSLKPIINFNNQ